MYAAFLQLINEFYTCISSVCTQGLHAQ